ncbi:MAG: aspartate kinase [Calditrichaeota bacterium]|nr:MAG: aspartate kinase [Calditrichota bacterium]
MKVYKFGGSSIRDAEAMKRVAGIVRKRAEAGSVVVLSALGGVTDRLIALYEQALERREKLWRDGLKDLKDRHWLILSRLVTDEALRRDAERFIEKGFHELEAVLSVSASIGVQNDVLYNKIVGSGELFASRIFAAVLAHVGCLAQWIDIRPLMRVTRKEGMTQPDKNHLRQHAQQAFGGENKGVIWITQGFIATDAGGAPATLGRDGSDYTAALLGDALDAEEIQIWTDVDGILSADPGIVNEAWPLQSMTFDEACELAYFGARVLHPATIQPAMQRGIPVRVLNSRKPSEKGTLITPHNGKTKPVSDLRSIAYKEDITLLTIESEHLLFSPRLLEKVFDILSRHGKGVYAVNKTATRLSLTLQNGRPGDGYIRALESFGRVRHETGKAVVCVVGEGIKGDLRLGREIIAYVQEEGINIEWFTQFQGQISMTFIIDEQNISATVRLLHDRYMASPVYSQSAGKAHD